MAQIIWNWLTLFISPFVLGLIVRLLFIRFKKFHFITIALTVLSPVIYFIIWFFPTGGNEGPALLASMFVLFVVPMVVVEIGRLVSYLVNNYQLVNKNKQY